MSDFSITAQNFRLKNTFGFETVARYFAAPSSSVDIKKLLDDFAGTPVLAAGGYSNIIFTEDFEGLVINPQIKAIDIIESDGKYCLMKVGAGVAWDDFVRFACENGYGGAENLSGIPGNVGAAPVQNIGAYGAEVKNIIVSVEGTFIDSRQRFELANAECKFGYRDSIFKNELRHKTVIDHVTFRLTVNAHEYRLDYGRLADAIKKCCKISPATVRDAVTGIRSSILPDPALLGNSGSFFKNPVVDEKTASRLSESYPEMPVFPSSDGIKLSAAWLIERAGLKGIRSGNVGVHHRQSLVLVNYGGATVAELLDFSKSVQEAVAKQFGVRLEPEVNIIGRQ